MSASRACVVIVEDEPDLLHLVCDVLEMDGFDVTGFNRPFDLGMLTAGPDVFVLDVMLPERSGIELAAMLRGEGYSAVPMIAMSASPLMLEHARVSGLFQAYLPKPFDLDVLVRVIAQQVAA